MNREEIRYHLTGLGASFRTPFNRDGSIDYDSVHNFIDFTISGGSKAIVLTSGDSLFTVLTEQEIAEVTKAVVEHTRGRALVVAADGCWPTHKTVEFAKYTREVGADVLMVLPPDWAASCTVRSMVDHYAAAAEHMPVMVVTNVFKNRGTSFSMEVIETLLAEVDNIVAVKDDISLINEEFVRRMCLLVHEHWAVWSGGFKSQHLKLHPYGCDGYLSCFSTFKPSIAQSYWRAIQAEDVAAAAKIIGEYEIPFFDFIWSLSGTGMRHDAGIHGAMEIFGVTQRWERMPYASLDDAEMEKLRDFFQTKSLL